MLLVCWNKKTGRQFLPCFAMHALA